MRSEKSLTEATYILLPAKMPFQCEYVDLYNRVFDFWEQRWAKAFAESGAPEGYWRDHYQRQDIIAALVTPTEVIGCHLYTFYNLDSHATLKSEYFHYLPELAIQKTKNLGLKNFVTMEYLCANPDWKINNEHLRISTLISALGLLIVREFGAEAAVGMPIIGSPVDKGSNIFERKSIYSPIEKYGYKLDYSYFPVNKELTINDKNISKMATHFLNKKISYIQLNSIRNKTNKLKIAV